MISYNWGVQPAVLQIRDRIKDAGLNYWIDVENMCTCVGQQIGLSGVFIRKNHNCTKFLPFPSSSLPFPLYHSPFLPSTLPFPLLSFLFPSFPSSPLFFSPFPSPLSPSLPLPKIQPKWSRLAADQLLYDSVQRWRNGISTNPCSISLL